MIQDVNTAPDFERGNFAESLFAPQPRFIRALASVATMISHQFFVTVSRLR